MSSRLLVCLLLTQIYIFMNELKYGRWTYFLCSRLHSSCYLSMKLWYRNQKWQLYMVMVLTLNGSFKYLMVEEKRNESWTFIRISLWKLVNGMCAALVPVFDFSFCFFSFIVYQFIFTQCIHWQKLFGIVFVKSKSIPMHMTLFNSMDFL